MTRKLTWLALALAACGESLPDDVDGYQTSCTKLNAAPIPAYAGDPHRGWKNVYACGVADDARPFPDGTLIVKESTRDGEAAPWLVATARKQAGKWRWDEYTRNFANESFRRVLASQSTCTGCHDRAKASDYVFTRRSPPDAAGGADAGAPPPDASPARTDAASPPRDAAPPRADAASSPADAASPAASDQLPPQDRAALQRWLATGAYKRWHCEATIMSPRPNGAHGRNRVCSNDVLAAHADDAAPFPVGAASVKELYGASDAITGYAVAVKVAAGDGGDAWYWAEGGITGVGASACTGCHAQAPRFGGRDFVYVRVR